MFAFRPILGGKPMGCLFWRLRVWRADDQLRDRDGHKFRELARCDGGAVLPEDAEILANAANAVAGHGTNAALGGQSRSSDTARFHEELCSVAMIGATSGHYQAILCGPHLEKRRRLWIAVIENESALKRWPFSETELERPHPNTISR